MRHRATGGVYAMKVMRKERILARDHSDYVRAERDLLTGERRWGWAGRASFLSVV